MRSDLDFSQTEIEVNRAAIEEPIWGFAQFTDFYCRDASTGTSIEPESDYMYDANTIHYGVGIPLYEYLYEEWKRQKKPILLLADSPLFARYYLQQIEYEVGMDGGNPIFFWRHGWVPLKWGAIMHYARQKEHTILGGFGSSKTAHVGMSAFVYCVTVPRFRFVCVAAYLSNAKPMFQEVKNVVEGTLAEKFIMRTKGGDLVWGESPFPRIRFYNGSEMVFMGAAEDLQKIRSESGDWYAIEQAESHTNLQQVLMELGTRARGKVRGRSRLGRMTFIANSGEAPELWDRFELSDTEPDTYFSYNLTSYDNPHLSKSDIESLERRCGGDQDTINQFMRGLKPVGKYEDFPREVILGCEDPRMDDMMAQHKMLGIPGTSEKVIKGLGHIEWSLPAQQNRDYAVYGDPGTKNPPSRGSGVVLVFDETDFPNRPAELVHYKWTMGNNMIGPWLNDFKDAVHKYRAVGRAYYEGTGDQKNIDELAFQDVDIMASRINLTGIKHGSMLKLKRMLERRYIRWAKAISPIRSQFSQYNEALDQRTSDLQQDIVMTFLLAAMELSKSIVDVMEVSQKGHQRALIRGRGGNRANLRVKIRARR